MRFEFVVFDLKYLIYDKESHKQLDKIFNEIVWDWVRYSTGLIFNLRDFPRFVRNVPSYLSIQLEKDKQGRQLITFDPRDQLMGSR